MSTILPKARATTWPGPLFFLAGPVRGGGDWQSKAYGLIKETMGPAFTAAIPMRYPEEHSLRREALVADPSAEPFERQMAWERHYLKLAGIRSSVPGCLLFWLANESESEPHPGPEPFAMDTRREMGEWYTRLEFLPGDVRMVVGAEEGFHGLDQFQRCLNESAGREFPIYGTLFDTVQAAVRIAKQE